MKFTGKIVQIIEEKKAKSYMFGSKFLKLNPDCDFLNIRPVEEKFLDKRISYTILLMFVGLIAFGIIQESNIIKMIGISILVLGILTIEYYNSKSIKQDWKFDSPFAVKKPHEFKVNDIVEITLEINELEEKRNVQ